MTKIFISYRREDSQWPADRLHQALKPVVADPRKDIFIDVDNIPLGVNFVDHLGAQVGQCDILLAMIGRGWIEARNPQTGQRRLDDPKDFVRIEIATALKRGIRVVPILVDGASVPKEEELPEDLRPLATRNGMELQRMNFDADVARLIRGLGLNEAPRSSKGSSKTSAKAATSQPQGRLMLWGWIALALSGPALVAAMAYMLNIAAEGDVSSDPMLGSIVILLSQPALGWLGCVLVAKAASRRPYWLVAILTLIACGPVGAAIWYFGSEFMIFDKPDTPLLIGSLAALAAGLVAYAVGRLIRKKTSA
ncbi:MAG TPA: toll/interleukin-1 receptor domain-containing protein [Hyphomonadaceae bacterium]|nr:toll/interleukin-1 receptor domain-containing protein [Hyphomonadaceae bacterium]